jgi:hypothetical protein
MEFCRTTMQQCNSTIMQSARVAECGSVTLNVKMLTAEELEKMRRMGHTISRPRFLYVSAVRLVFPGPSS